MFQIDQYNKTILHYSDMNYRYYKSIYLDPHPTAEDKSLLDDNIVMNEDVFDKQVIYVNEELNIVANNGNDTFLNIPIQTSAKHEWIKIEAYIQLNAGYYDTHLLAILDTKKAFVRINNPISKEGHYNRYVLYMRSPHDKKTKLKLLFAGSSDLQANIKQLKLTVF